MKGKLMSRKKQKPLILTILSIICLSSAAWYILFDKPSKMDSMQHPATNLKNEDPCSIPQTTPNINTPVTPEVITYEITEPSQLQTLIQDGKPAVIKFYAPWCGACNHVDSYYKDVAGEFNEKVTFYSLNIDTPELSTEAEKLGINKEKILYLPTFVFFQTGKIQEQQTGVLQKEALIKKVATVFDIIK